MKVVFLSVLCLMLLTAAGCTTTTTVLMLDIDMDEHVGEAGLRVDYLGTEGYYHYFDLCHSGRRKHYRISKFLLEVAKTFPLETRRQEVHWVSLEAYQEDRKQIMKDRKWILVPVEDGLYMLKLVPAKKKSSASEQTVPDPPPEG